MPKPRLHFAHANSFPAGTYRQFFTYLRQSYEVQALEMHGHDPQFPVCDGWPHLVRELEQELRSRYQEPVILVGHSLGGMLAAMLGATQPQLVRCVVLLDSPLVAGWRASSWRLVKALGQGDRFSPAQFSHKRREVWPDIEAAFAHFVAKPLFACWPKQVLRDYLNAGLVPHEQGVTLRFTRETETAIYRALPHHFGSLLKRPYPVPIGFVGGDNSNECRQAGLQATRRLVGCNFTQIPGGHLFPMENPAQAAFATAAMIENLLAQCKK